MRRQHIKEFQNTVWTYYDAHGRHELPWRQPEIDGTFDPYKIMVSEVMLQQTQAGRVVPKYITFLELFPTVRSLAKNELGDVLRAWQGLGYNRRAKYLWQASQAVTTQLGGVFPKNLTQLVKLPGIGPNTAAAILAYSFNQPSPFIETNIRTVFIHHFFAGQSNVSDKAILEIVAATLPEDTTLTRAWYWALMDYGVHLKQTQGNLNKLSKSYTKQSAFHGSRRQVRGQVIRLLHRAPLTLAQLRDEISDERLDAVLNELLVEQMIREEGGTYLL